MFKNDLEYYYDLNNPREEFEKIPLKIIFLFEKLNLKKNIVLGFDTRKSSKHYAEQFSKSNLPKLEINFINKYCSYPEFGFVMKELNSGLGLYFTGGDNTADFCGLKIFLSNEIEKNKFIDDLNKVEIKEFTENQSIVNEINLSEKYYLYLKNSINLELFNNYSKNILNNTGIIIDSFGGTATTIIEDILNPLGFRAQSIFCVPDEKFYSRTPKINLIETESLKYNVKSTESLIGVIFNTDASNLAIVKDDGNLFSKKEIEEKYKIVEEDNFIFTLKFIETLISQK